MLKLFLLPVLFIFSLSYLALQAIWKRFGVLMRYKTSEL